MSDQPYTPRVMVHPAYKKSVPEKFQATGSDGVTIDGYHGDPDVFPPVTVSRKSDEDYHRSMGYRIQGEAAPGQSYNVYPMWMTKAGADDRLVEDDDEQAAAEAAGYTCPGAPDPEAFEREFASPYDPHRVHSEFPKMVDGKEVDPSAAKAGPIEYPKWVGDTLVHNHAQEVALLGSAAVPDRLAMAQGARDRAKAAADAAKATADAADAELAALLADGAEAPATDPADGATDETPPPDGEPRRGRGRPRLNV